MSVCAQALEARKSAKLPRVYYDWDDQLGPNASGNTPYTPIAQLLYGLQASLALLKAEGFDNVVKRHYRWVACTPPCPTNSATARSAATAHPCCLELQPIYNGKELGCRLAEGTRKAVDAWGLKLLCKHPRWRSDSLTVIETPQVQAQAFAVTTHNICSTARPDLSSAGFAGG